MLRIDPKDKQLREMKRRSLADAGYLERDGLQKLICQAPDLFFAELGEELLLVAQEVKPTEQVDDRIDVLAIDRQGAIVVIELKRGSNRFQLLQGISYAAMISDWSREDLIETLRVAKSWTTDRARESVEEFLADSVATLNDAQRVILIAEDFDFEVLITAKWLSETGGIDVRCFRLYLTTDGHSEMLSCMRIFPIPQLQDHARLRRNRLMATDSPADWDAVLSSITNNAIREFMLAEVVAGAESNLNSKNLIYRLGGKRRFFVGARRERAYVWQRGRFFGDIRFWSEQLSPGHNVEPVNGCDDLRFYLLTDQDCTHFKRSLDQELVKVQFLESEAALVAQQIPETPQPSS